MDQRDRLLVAASRRGYTSLRQVAAAVGCSHSWINQALAGERPADPLWANLGRVLLVPKQWLVDGRRTDAPAWAKPIYDLEDARDQALAEHRDAVAEALQRRLDEFLLRRRSRRRLVGMDATARERELIRERDAALLRAERSEAGFRALLDRLAEVGIDPSAEWPPRVVKAARARRMLEALLTAGQRATGN